PVLEIADSVMTYRRRYFAEARLVEVLELLLRDETNPRSLAFQVNQLRDHAAALPRAPNSSDTQGKQGHAQALALALASVDLSALVAGGESYAPLLGWLDQCSSELNAFSDELTSRYFSHTVPRVS